MAIRLHTPPLVRVRPAEFLEHGSCPVVDVAAQELGGVPDGEPGVGAIAARQAREQHAGGAVDQLGSKAGEVQRDGERWNTIMVEGMKNDFSWKASASRYMELYR